MRSLLLSSLIALSGAAATAETTLTFEGLILSRQQDDRVTLIEDNVGGPPIMTTDDLGTAVGAAFGLSYRTEFAGRGVHLRGIYAPGVSANAAFDNQVVNFSGFNFAAADPNGYGLFCFCTITGDLTFERATSLGSLEANVDIASRGAFTFFGGLRAFMLDDELSGSIDGTDTGFGYVETRANVQADNRMYGPQIGLSGHFPASASGVSVNVFGSIGYFHNDAKVTTRSQSFGILASSEIRGDASRDFWTPGAEFDVTVKVDMRKNTSLSLGYNAIYLREVADSVASFGSSAFNTTPIAGFGTTDALFHGAKIEFRAVF